VERRGRTLRAPRVGVSLLAPGSRTMPDLDLTKDPARSAPGCARPAWQIGHGCRDDELKCRLDRGNRPGWASQARALSCAAATIGRQLTDDQRC